MESWESFVKNLTDTFKKMDRLEHEIEELESWARIDKTFAHTLGIKDETKKIAELKDKYNKANAFVISKMEERIKYEKENK